MKPKKDQELELKKNSVLYFSLGLAAVMLLAYVALEWKTYYKNDWDLAKLNLEDELIEEVPITFQELPPPPPPKIQTPRIIEIVDNDEDIIETVIESNEPDQDTEIVDVKEVVYEEIEEDPIISISVVEEVPIFPGCENVSDKKACFERMILKHVRKTFRYPENAQEMGIQGKVYMNFIIQKDGNIGDIKIVRSPDNSLGAEASRIISKIPKMEPGKQQGKPVKVPFSIPITFKLQ